MDTPNHLFNELLMQRISPAQYRERANAIGISRANIELALCLFDDEQKFQDQLENDQLDAPEN
jgi:hypothetical protein